MTLPAPRLLVFASLILSTILSTSCISRQMRALNADEQNDVALLVVADRGASDVAPENTFAAFDKAQQLGALAIELDVQLSKDGQVVIFRDDTLDEKTNLKGPVASHAWAELATVDLEHWFSVMKRTSEPVESAAPEPQAQSKPLVRHRLSKHLHTGAAKKVPKSTSLTRLLKLGDLFERYGLTFQYYIVLHGNPSTNQVAGNSANNDRIGAATLKLVKEFGVINNVVIVSPDYDYLARIRKDNQAATLCYLIDETKTPDINAEIQRAVSLGFQQLGVRTRLLTHDQVKRARSANIKIFAYDRASDDEIAQAVKVGAAAVASPVPDHTAKVIEAASKIHY